MKKIVLSVAAMVTMSSLVFAEGESAASVLEADESSFYVGVGVAAVSTRDASVSSDFFNVKPGQDRLGNFSFLAGYDYNQYVAAEGRYTTTYTDEDLVEMSGWSLFIKPQYPVNEEFSIYALLGFGGVTMDAVKNSGADVDDSGFQWGIGMSYEAMEDFSIFIDYTSLANDMDGYYYTGALQVDADAITIGMIYKF